MKPSIIFITTLTKLIRVGKLLIEGKENAYLSQYLAKIVTNLELKLDLEQARINRFDPAKVEDLFRELEFRTLMQKLKTIVNKINPNQGPGSQMSLFDQEVEIDVQPHDNPHGINIIVVDSENKLQNCTKALNAAKTIAFDTETTGIDALQAQLVGIALAVDENEGFYIPIGHQEGKQLSIEQVREALSSPFTNKQINKVAHNAKYDLMVLNRFGFQITPITCDTMIAEWLLNPDSRNLSLKNLAWVRLGVEMTHIEALIGSGKSQRSMAAVAINEVAPYAGADAVMTLRLMQPLLAELEQNKLKKILNEVEMPLIPILADMEKSGISLDIPYFLSFAKELDTKLITIEQNIFEMVGEPFNLNSTQQLSNVLFKRLQLEPPDRSRKTSSGFYSTAAGVLEEMRGQHEVVDQILEYRELSKLKSTYVDPLPMQVNPQTGRIHTSFNQTGTATGRIASANPNLQNIPTRTELGRRVRNGFIAKPGHLLLAVDYSQIELRIVAHMAHDQAMLEAFNKGQDIHATTAAAIYDMPLEKVTKKERRHAKAINFGLIYGMSPFGLTRSTDLTLAEAENFVKAYFERFPGIKTWLDHTRKIAAEQGYVETMIGRRRYFPNLKSGTNYMVKQREEREAINAPIQGTAADIMKLAMADLPNALSKAGLKAKMLLQVHDELILEVPIEELAETASHVMQVMENAFKLDIPLTTEARSGKNWGELEPLD